MEFKDIQSKVMENAINYGKNYKIEIDEEFALIKLFEEVGELAQAVLIHRKKSRPEKHVSEEKPKEHLAEELADVIGMAMVNAKLLGVDLESMLIKKWIGREV